MNTVRLGIVLLSICLSSCAVGPNYQRPCAPISNQFKEAQGKQVIGQASKNWKIAAPQNVEAKAEWWRIFNDETLNYLETQLNQQNQNIINAYYNYGQACALVGAAQAPFYPMLLATLDMDRQKSATALIATNTTILGTTAKPPIIKTHTFIGQASWELDVWGLIRRQVEAANSAAQSNAALWAATRLSQQGLLAQYYYQLRGLDNIQKLLNDTVKNDKKLLQLTKNQYAAGVASEADVVQAESVLESAQALAINNGIARGQYEHAIAVLMGRPPALFSLPAVVSQLTPPLIPISLPSTLLERRPDIAQAERLMAETNAQIGVAIAAYFPIIQLTGSITAAGLGLGHLTSLPSVSWIYGLQLAETILDGGLRAANVRAARAGYFASVAAYRQVVLNAFQEVEDDLLMLRTLEKQAIVEKKAVTSALHALQIVINQYKSGTVPYSSVITAQNTLFVAQQAEVTVAYQRMTAAAGLVKALGGGWTPCDIPKLADCDAKVLKTS